MSYTDSALSFGRVLVASQRNEFVKRGSYWLVPSLTHAGKRYKVWLGENPRCTCESLLSKCVHIYAAECVQQEEDEDDDALLEFAASTAPQRKTYKQNWPAYNKAQTSEKREFLRLLHDLCKSLKEPIKMVRRRGRPRISLAESVFATVFKVYSGFSGRRFMSDLHDTHHKGFIHNTQHFNSISNFLSDNRATRILANLIEISSTPLRVVESDFAVDSTGFGASSHERWYDQKYGKAMKGKRWIKAHVCCGVKTNIVTAVEMTDGYSADSPMLPILMRATNRNFSMKEVSADKGYLSAKNMEIIAEHGAKPFIAFKKNSKSGGNGPMWDKMFHYFCFNRDAYLEHYHKRSNVETTMMMVKSKFGGAVRSKGDIAMKNEALAKILCHNIVCVIHATHELGIKPVFGLDAA